LSSQNQFNFTCQGIFILNDDAKKLRATVGLAAVLEFRDSSADNCSPIEKLE